MQQNLCVGDPVSRVRVLGFSFAISPPQRAHPRARCGEGIPTNEVRGRVPVPVAGVEGGGSTGGIPGNVPGVITGGVPGGEPGDVPGCVPGGVPGSMPGGLFRSYYSHHSSAFSP